MKSPDIGVIAILGAVIGAFIAGLALFFIYDNSWFLWLCVPSVIFLA